VVAYLLGSAVGWYSHNGDGPGIIASTVGALIVLGIYRAFMGRRRAWSP
jgi:uncharacterized membrane protein YeaQ/YmgE (transglycosylase-associated protein family)